MCKELRVPRAQLDAPPSDHRMPSKSPKVVPDDAFADRRGPSSVPLLREEGKHVAVPFVLV